MNNEEYTIKAIPNFLNLKNFIFEGVRSATFGIIKKDPILPYIIHYESTNKKYSSFYNNSREAKMCHIVRTAAKYSTFSKDFTLVWNLLIPDNDESKFMNQKRIELDHCNGVTIFNNISSDLLLCATFTGPQNDDNFAINLLKNKKRLLKNTINTTLLK